ncbi:hypothetical protein BHE74_00001659 [Ensete ventricosum]|nr:hypothetical protein BHE74_00001659 [Ensete ventricosum]
MEKRPQMSYLKYMLNSAREEVRKALRNDFKVDQYIRIIDRRIKNILTKLCLAAYYLNPAIQYRYALGTHNESLMTLRNIVYRILPSVIDATEALTESRYFRDTIGSFFDVVAVSSRYTMNPVAIEWWIQFGGNAPHLRKVVIRVLSQTITSSGYKHNWSTFALIHTKVRNRLSYRRLEKLVYVHYNIRPNL